MFRTIKKPNIIIRININIDLIINYEKFDFNIDEIINIFDDFNINVLNNFNINIFVFNVVIVFVENIMNITSFKKLIIRCFFNVFFITNINTTIKRYRLLKKL